MESEGRVGGGGGGEGGYCYQDHPPGFRFAPKDQDLLGFYLHRKKATTAQGQGAGIPLPPAIDAAIPTLDLFVPDAPPPWLLHPAASSSSLLLLDDDGGDKGLFARSIAPRDITEWFYCFSRTTPRGSGSARATKVGTWQTTIGERKVQDCRGSTLGYKSTLAFKVPSAGGGGTRGVATDWVMHEFKIHAGRERKREAAAAATAAAKRNNGSSDRRKSSSSPPDDDDETAAEEWVLCRIRCTKHTVTGPPREEEVKEEEEQEKGGGFGMQGRQEVLPQPADYCADDQVVVDVTGREQKRRRTSEGPLPGSRRRGGGGGDLAFCCFLQAEEYPLISSSGKPTPEQSTAGVEQGQDGSGQLVPAEGGGWRTTSGEHRRIMFSPAVFFSPSEEVPGAGTVGGDMDFDDGEGWVPSPWAMEVAAAMGVDIGPPSLNASPVLLDDVPGPKVVVAPLEPATVAAAASHGTGGRSLEEEGAGGRSLEEEGGGTGTNISRGDGIMAAEHASSSGMISKEEEDHAWWDAIAVDGSCCIKNNIQDGAQSGHHVNAYSWELLMDEDTLGPPEYAFAAAGAAGSEVLEGACGTDHPTSLWSTPGEMDLAESAQLHIAA